MMTEWRKATWADVREGDTVRTPAGYVWTILTIGRGGAVKMCPVGSGPNVPPVTGTPPATRPVEIEAREMALPPGVIACGPVAPGAEDIRIAREYAAQLAVRASAASDPEPGDLSAERGTITGLRAAGLDPVVIERVMTLAELVDHLVNDHGSALPARGALIGVEYRSRLADLHFAEHLKGQAVRVKWAPRGELKPHTHPVMDRPMTVPTS